MKDKFQELCNKRSSVHSKIKNIMEKRLQIASNNKSCLSLSEQVDKLYADLDFLYNKDFVLLEKQQIWRKQNTLTQDSVGGR